MIAGEDRDETNESGGEKQNSRPFLSGANAFDIENEINHDGCSQHSDRNHIDGKNTVGNDVRNQEGLKE